MSLENQGSKSVSEADFAHLGILERPKEDLAPNFLKLDDFEKTIQDIDSKIHCYDKVVVVSLDSYDSLPATDKAYSTYTALPTGPTIEVSHSQPIKPTALSDLSNMDLDHIHLEAWSEGKWVRFQRLAHTKGSHNSEVILGKCTPLNLLESSIPKKRKAHTDATQNENCPPVVEVDLQPRRGR